MHCSHCGVCCEKTEMMLSSADVERLEKMSHNRQEFMRCDGRGFVRLRNRHKVCVFYDVERHRCKVYRHRPLGCRIYPVIYSEQDGIVLDDLCPMRSTVSKVELRRKGKKVMELLQRIDTEAACDGNRVKKLKGVE
jgi:Fe-S-cluster containining protein